MLRRISRSPGDQAIDSAADLLQAPQLSTGQRQIAAADLAQLQGNRFLQRVILQRAAQERGRLQRQAEGNGGQTPAANEGQAAAAESKSKVKPPKKLRKEKVTAQRAKVLLNDAFGSFKAIQVQNLRALSDADIIAAYQNIFQGTEYDYHTYIVPASGFLDGFEYEGITYVNTTRGSRDVIPHELLHAHASPAWDTFLDGNEEIDEGVTEYLTKKAVRAAGIKPTSSYPRQYQIIRRLVRRAGEDKLLNAYFKGATEELKKAMEKTSRGTWEQFWDAMITRNWAAASAAVARPKEPGS